MLVYMSHPDHGHMPAYDASQIDYLEKLGWSEDKEWSKPKSQEVLDHSEKRKAGRPKVNHGAR